MNRLFKCFNEIFYLRFEKFAYSNFYIPEPGLIRDAFTDGTVAFYLKVRTQGFQERGATVDTVLMEFCRRSLLALFRGAKKDWEMHSYQDPVVFNQSATADEETKAAIVEAELKDATLDKAWQMLGEKCRQILLYRKIEKRELTEIAAKTGLSPISVSDKVHKCFNKIKELVQSINPVKPQH
ncbi:MAG: RNA polymerase sigma factor [Pseudobacter sp.]|uniref:RNA polymerase sigma factor n=1 Tax=Pseudobacter sp. TaxID=2045420 RepID=UPI003F81811E